MPKKNPQRTRRASRATAVARPATADATRRSGRPMVRIELVKWPVPGMTRQKARSLAQLFGRDLTRRLLAPMDSKRPKAAASARDGETSSDDPPVDCHLTGWEYEIVEIDGVPTLCRIEHYVCTDGSSYQLVIPI